MYSGNSSSMQSSSGGDDDVNSKAESSIPMSMPMPLFLDHHALSHPNYYNLNNSFLPSSLMFETDYLPNATNSSQTQPPQNPNPSSHLHLDTFRPVPSWTDQGGLPAASLLSRPNMLDPQGLGQAQQYQPSSSSAATTTKEPTKAAKNPRKRMRASRRAPTTVLTTDTGNFRAMVQEFTGFPAPPFSGSRKLDLFGSGSIFRTSPRGPDPLGNMYPLRPSAQKLQQPPLMSDTGNTNSNPDANSIISNALMSTITSSIAQMAANTGSAADSNTGAANTGSAADSNTGAATTSLLNLPKHPSANHQNPITLPNPNTLFTFPSLMHDHDPLNAPAAGLLHRFGAENDPSVQDQFGAKWDRPQAHADTADADNGNNRGRWLNEEEYGRGSMQRVNLNVGCKMNYTAASSSSSDYHHHHNNDKGLENITTTRAEGTAVDNWFGSSD